MSEWISVNERLPESDDCVMVFSSLTHIDMAAFDVQASEFFSLTTGDYQEVVDDPTHWMPLPELPDA